MSRVGSYRFLAVAPLLQVVTHVCIVAGEATGIMRSAPRIATAAAIYFWLATVFGLSHLRHMRWIAALTLTCMVDRDPIRYLTDQERVCYAMGVQRLTFRASPITVSSAVAIRDPWPTFIASINLHPAPKPRSIVLGKRLDLYYF